MRVQGFEAESEPQNSHWPVMSKIVPQAGSAQKGSRNSDGIKQVAVELGSSVASIRVECLRHPPQPNRELEHETAWNLTETMIIIVFKSKNTGHRPSCNILRLRISRTKSDTDCDGD